MQPINPVPSRGATICGGDKIRQERGMIKVRGADGQGDDVGTTRPCFSPQRQDDESNIYCRSRDGWMNPELHDFTRAVKANCPWLTVRHDCEMKWNSAANNPPGCSHTTPMMAMTMD